MSEFRGENDIFESLRRDLEDPYVVDFLNSLRKSQSELNNYERDGEMADDVRAGIVRSLNSSWIYYDQSVKVSGNITMLSKTDGEADYKKMSIEDMDAYSKGFEIYRPSSIDNESDEDDLRYAMVFMVNDKLGNAVYALADIDSVSVEYPFPSQEKLEQRLDGDLLEYREQLDEIIFQDASLGDILKELALFEYDYNTGRGQDKDAVKALERYIDQVLDFDQQLPYYVVLEKNINIIKGSRAYPKKVDGELRDIVGIQGVRLYKTAITENGEVTFLTPFVKMTHYSSENGYPDTEYLVDVRDIKSVISMRDGVDTKYFD